MKFKALNLGKAISTARNSRGMSRKELGIAINFNKSLANFLIYQYESGLRVPGKRTLRKIEKVLNCSFKRTSYITVTMHQPSHKA